MSDAPEEARQPLQPWQYILIIAAIAGILILLWLALRGGGFWHRDDKQHIERAGSGAGGSSQTYAGPPDAQETQAKQVAATTAFKQAAKVDEDAEFAAPIETQQGGRVSMPSMPSLSGVKEAAAGAADTVAQATTSGGSLLLPAASAYRVPHPEFTIRRGTLIPCNDVTVIDTSSGGPVLVKATIPQDVWGIGHKMVLLDKGTEVLGEVGHGLVNGLDRVGVVWREATTPYPNSVGISLDSPASGPLGEGGLDGEINRHEWQKIKGVVMLSLLQGGLNIAQSLAQREGTANINFSGVTTNGQQLGESLLQAQISIPDTIHRNEGKACSIFLARDLDFHSVYSLKAAQ